jgi:hypothetical protein
VSRQMNLSARASHLAHLGPRHRVLEAPRFSKAHPWNRAGEARLTVARQKFSFRAAWDTRPGCDFRICPKVASSRLPSTAAAPSN